MSCFFVASDYRGKQFGLASALLGALIEWAKLRQFATVYLGTTSRFLAAHRFYERHGFDLVDKEALPDTFPLMAVDSRFYRISI